MSQAPAREYPCSAAVGAGCWECAEKNAKTYDAGQHDVEKLVRAWADSRGHAVDSDWTKYYVHAGQNDYEHGRDRTLSMLRADR
ncbi:hypothetical protein [Streptomyces collinus]|uniref:hypothetical protein n=1 Tax=Streptomyces collinus TaxID=42684 RepID=UPI0033C72BEF